MPQSILLHGPKGIGKATFAYHLARYLFQGQPENFHVEQTSPLFVQVDQGVCENLKVLTRTSQGSEKKSRTISIESIRQIIQFLQTTARHHQWRVVVIDSVDELHYKAANALLKSLEEPPQKTLIILIAHSLGRVLPTLKSRCLLFGKNFVNHSDLHQAMALLLPSMAEDEQDLYLRYAMGCPGRMISLMTLGGKSFYQNFLKMIRGLIDNDLRPIVSSFDKLPNQNNADSSDESFDTFLIWWLGHLLQPLRQKQTMLADEKTIIKELLQKHPQHFWQDFWHHATQLIRQTHDISLDRRAVLLALFCDMAYGQP